MGRLLAGCSVLRPRLTMSSLKHVILASLIAILAEGSVFKMRPLEKRPLWNALPQPAGNITNPETIDSIAPIIAPQSQRSVEPPWLNIIDPEPTESTPNFLQQGVSASFASEPSPPLSLNSDSTNLFVIGAVGFTSNAASFLLPKWPNQKYIVLTATRHASHNASVYNVFANLNTTGTPGATVDLRRQPAQCTPDNGLMGHAINFLVAREGSYQTTPNRILVVGSTTVRLTISAPPPMYIQHVISLRAKNGNGLFPSGEAIVLAQVQETSFHESILSIPNIRWTSQNRDIMIRMQITNNGGNLLLGREVSIRIGYIAFSPQHGRSENGQHRIESSKSSWTPNPIHLPSQPNSLCSEPVFFMTPEVVSDSVFGITMSYDDNWGSSWPATANLYRADCSTVPPSAGAVRLGLLTWQLAGICASFTAMDLQLQDGIPNEEVNEDSSGLANSSIIYLSVGSSVAVLLFGSLVFYYYYRKRQRAAQQQQIGMAQFQIGQQLLTTGRFQPQGNCASYQFQSGRPGIPNPGGGFVPTGASVSMPGAYR